MEDQHREKQPKSIIRRAEVLRRTGLSRSSIYLRIAKNESPPTGFIGCAFGRLGRRRDRGLDRTPVEFAACFGITELDAERAVSTCIGGFIRNYAIAIQIKQRLFKNKDF